MPPYSQNTPEDAIAMDPSIYLEDRQYVPPLYGIHSAADIQKVLIGGRELETSKIGEFYTYFSALKNSSAGYFESLKGGSRRFFPDFLI